MTKKAIIRGLIWIGILLLISILIVGLFYGFINGEPIDIQLHDTYFVFSGDPILHILWIWIYLILIKYVLQGLILLAKQSIVIAVVLSLILLGALSITVLGIVFLSVIAGGLLTMLILMMKELIIKIRLLTSSKHHGS